MESKNAQFLRQGVIDRCRRMTPAQRVRMFIEHSKLMRKVKDAGERDRRSPKPESDRNG